MDSVLKDIRYAMRGLLRRPGFSAVAIITLALGLGANTAIFSVVQGVLLEPLPYPESDRLVALRQVNLATNPAQPDTQIIGKRINVNTGPESYREIVGIVGDVKQNGLTKETKPHTYEPFALSPNQFMRLIVRSTTDPASLVPAIRSKVLALDGELPLQRVTTLDRVISNSIRQQRFTSVVLSVFAGVALLLAAAGLYGVISYSVAQRTYELGIRVALGAQVKDVMRMVFRQGMTIVLAGEVVGIIGALALTRLLSGLLFGVTPTDAVTFTAVTVILTVVALLACYIPARRATMVDPLIALRHE